MQCEKCAAEIKTTGLLWSHELRCKACGVIYIREDLVSPEKFPFKIFAFYLLGSLSYSTLLHFLKQTLSSHQFESLHRVVLFISVFLTLFLVFWVFL